MSVSIHSSSNRAVEKVFLLFYFLWSAQTKNYTQDASKIGKFKWNTCDKLTRGGRSKW